MPSASSGVAKSELKACSGCKNVWYCSPEHQRQDWKRHKHLCKEHQRNNLSMILGSLTSTKLMSCGHPVPALTDQKDWTEDFVKLHKYEITLALAGMLLKARGRDFQFDPLEEFVEFKLRYKHDCMHREEDVGNPAMTYDVIDASVKLLAETSPGTQKYMKNFAERSVVPNLMAHKMNPDSTVVSIIPIFFIDPEYGVPYISSCPIQEHDLEDPEERDILPIPWWAEVAVNAKTGLVWRRFEETRPDEPYDFIDIPGKLVRKDVGEWQWQEVSSPRFAKVHVRVLTLSIGGLIARPRGYPGSGTRVRFGAQNEVMPMLVKYEHERVHGSVDGSDRDSLDEILQEVL
ncbi:hypothetical protein K488DRAFT_82972 [Vararia minispora EC-137]|uniref:Uncharacterized protein n=1 Tax=Vararia minispora EC-137 TaxID=1314806 RepID=A0ACB8QUJ3_9AGAM|nr:hypothetical protein K488DRAFT_82972 [Vararia minispora EC-137]